jgi:hypothetical protein
LPGVCICPPEAGWLATRLLSSLRGTDESGAIAE